MISNAMFSHSTEYFDYQFENIAENFSFSNEKCFWFLTVFEILDFWAADVILGSGIL